MLDKIAHAVMRWGTPLVALYHLITGNIFLNTVHEEARGLEWVGNVILAPTHYLLAGKFISKEGKETLRFNYSDPAFMTKTVTSLVVLPVTLPLGCAVKGLSYLSDETKKHHKMIVRGRLSKEIEPHESLYKALGLQVNVFQEGEGIEPPTYQRRPGDESHMEEEKEALREIVRLLSLHSIPFWMDCGALLGTYRYGGVIPWDIDLDLAILQVDSQNVRRVLQDLDKTRFQVQDWSSRDKPHTYLKVYIKKTGRLIDFYHFRIDTERGLLQTIVSNVDCMFLPAYWAERENRYTNPIPISYVFPLKKGTFDGIEVPVPNDTVQYLQNQYGNNLAPCKIYDEKTGNYEKDLSHPYWKFPHAQ